jgi:DNA repair protein RecN (Recombination protein N)
LASFAQEAIQVLDDGSPESPAVTDLFGQVITALSGLVRLDRGQSALLEQAQMAAENLTDLARSLQNYLEGIEFNPKRLDQIEERLNALHLLKRKYGNTPAATIKDVLAYLEKAINQLEKITHAGERFETCKMKNANCSTIAAKVRSSLKGDMLLKVFKNR